MAKRLFSFIFFLSFVFGVLAQKEPMKYGKVDKVDLEMKVYSPDSSASAVVLCNYGYFDSNQMQFVHQRRIKILKEEGKSWGDVFAPASTQTISIKGQTVNLENGVLVVTKLGKEGTFIERITRGVYRAKAAMPNVKVGSVIDVEYSFKGLPPPYWSFQEVIPVKWSELIIERNSYFSFRQTFTGYIPLSETASDRWVTKDVPAFKSEPLVDNASNYLTRMNIEISSIHIPGQLYEDYATTWEAVKEILKKEDNFGGKLDQYNLFLNGLVKDIKLATSSPEERMAKAYEAVKRIKWNKSEAIYCSKEGLNNAFTKQIGNSADINLILVILLRKLEVNANPIVMSTRNNGFIPPHSVSLDKLNYVLAHAAIGEKTYLLDATDEHLPLGFLPKRAINGKGMLIGKETISWVDLTPIKKDKEISLLELDLTADGKLKGTWSKSYFDYGAYQLRTKIKNKNGQEDYLKDIESKYHGLSVDEYNIKNLDSLQLPITENLKVSIKNKITKTGDQIFIQPILFDSYSENPLKAEKRVYPVDFTTGSERTFMFYLNVPEGYAVEQLPKNIKMSLPGNTATVQRMSSVNENRIQVLFKVFVNKPVFYQPEYQDLKLFFDELVKKQAEMLILKKI
jgi:hypothetical protein